MDAPTHRVTTSDGVSIGATVRGHGRSLVFLHGVLGDGDLDWGQVAAEVEDRFTCHLPSYRGRGASREHTDLSPGRLVEDCTTYVESIGEPIGLVGWSGGAAFALAVAAQSDAVSKVVAFEPPILSVMDEPEQAVLGTALARTGELLTDGHPAAAAQAFAGWPLDDEEIAMARRSGYFEAAGRYVPNMLALMQQWMTYEGPTADDPAVLGAIHVPVLVLLGLDTRPFFAAGARHVAGHVPDLRIQEVPGAGHGGPLTHPAVIAEVLVQFFSPAPHPV